MKVKNKKWSIYSYFLIILFTIGVSVGITWGIITIVLLFTDSGNTINPTEVVQKYVLKENKPNLNNVNADSITDDYVEKKLVNENYLLKHDKDPLAGLTVKRNLNPEDITNRYVRLPTGTSIGGVTSPLVTESYISKEEVTNKYHLVFGETNTIGIFSKEEYDPSSFIISNKEIENGNGTGELLYSILSIPKKNISLAVNARHTVLVGSTGAVGYITDDPDSKVPLQSIRLKKGVLRNFYIITQLLVEVDNNGVVKKDGREPYYYGVHITMLLNEDGTITTNIVEAKGAVKTTTAKAQFSWNDGDAAPINWASSTSVPNLNTLLSGLTQVLFRRDS